MHVAWFQDVNTGEVSRKMYKYNQRTKIFSALKCTVFRLLAYQEGMCSLDLDIILVEVGGIIRKL